jgi:hypothetical protein
VQLGPPKPGGHAHVPPTHNCGYWQARPQLPQLKGSVVVSAHPVVVNGVELFWKGHHVRPAGHETLGGGAGMYAQVPLTQVAISPRGGEQVMPQPPQA